jgi:hypothetical protein
VFDLGHTNVIAMKWTIKKKKKLNILASRILVKNYHPPSYDKKRARESSLTWVVKATRDDPLLPSNYELSCLYNIIIQHWSWNDRVCSLRFSALELSWKLLQQGQGWFIKIMLNYNQHSFKEKNVKCLDI